MAIKNFLNNLNLNLSFKEKEVKEVASKGEGVKNIITDEDFEIDKYVIGGKDDSSLGNFLSSKELINIKSFEDFKNNENIKNIINKYYPNISESDMEGLYNSLMNVDTSFITAINSIISNLNMDNNTFKNTFGFSEYTSKVNSETGRINNYFNYEYLFLDVLLNYTKNDLNISSIEEVYKDDNSSTSANFEYDITKFDDSLKKYLNSKNISSDITNNIINEFNSTTKNNDSILVKNKIITVPNYYQQDYNDVYLAYDGYVGPRTVATSGCGFTAAAMLVSYLTGKEVTPNMLVDDWARSYYVYNEGMDMNFPKDLAEHYNLGEVTEVGNNNPTAITDALKNGKIIMCSQGSGPFTSSGHIILLTGITEDGKILVNDPNKENSLDKGYQEKAFDISEINNSAIKYWIYEN